MLMVCFRLQIIHTTKLLILNFIISNRDWTHVGLLDILTMVKQVTSYDQSLIEMTVP